MRQKRIRVRFAAAVLAVLSFGALTGPVFAQPDMEPEIPRDPADNQPLEYRAGKEKGYKIIAVTSTEMTNEGRKPTNRLDVGFTVAR